MGESNPSLMNLLKIMKTWQGRARQDFRFYNNAKLQRVANPCDDYQFESSRCSQYPLRENKTKTYYILVFATLDYLGK